MCVFSSWKQALEKHNPGQVCYDGSSESIKYLLGTELPGTRCNKKGSLSEGSTSWETGMELERVRTCWKLFPTNTLPASSEPLTLSGASQTPGLLVTKGPLYCLLLHARPVLGTSHLLSQRRF